MLGHELAVEQAHARAFRIAATSQASATFEALSARG